MSLDLRQRWLHHPVRQVLAQPLYRGYALSNIPNLLGLWVQRTTIGWLTWELTHSAFWLGAVSMAELAPSLVLAPIAGVFADRYSRLQLLRLTQGLIVLQALLFCLLLWAEQLTLPVLLSLVLLHGVTVSFAQPARMALVSSLIDREWLTSAVSLNAIIFNLARFLGPMVAGAGLVWWNPIGLLGLSAAGYLWFWSVLWRLRVREEHVGLQEGPPQSVRHSLLEGMNYGQNHPLLGPWLVSFIALCVGIRELAELLPGIADLLFQQGVTGLAWLSSSLGLGAMVGSLWMSQQPRTALVRIYQFSAWGLCGLLTLLAWSPSFEVAVVVIGGCGLLLMVSGIATQTTLQLEVAPRFRGRMLSLYGVIIRGGPALGALLVGTLTDQIGMRWPLLLSATLTATILWRKLLEIPNSSASETELLQVVPEPPPSVR